MGQLTGGGGQKKHAAAVVPLGASHMMWHHLQVMPISSHELLSATHKYTAFLAENIALGLKGNIVSH